MSEHRLATPNGKPKTLAAVRPNLSVEAAYRRRLEAMITEMARSYAYWIKAQWRSNAPVLAQDDDSPAMGLRTELDDLGAQWQAKFDTMAEEFSRHWARKALGQADSSFQSVLRRGGWTVKFKLTPAANQALQSTIGAQIGLIKSIPQEYFADVQGAVMRGVQTGRDLASITEDLQKIHGVTRRRAETIARDQSNKATATITRVRQQELGITKCQWMHSGAGKHPRESHVAFAKGRDGGPFYDPVEGALIDGKRIWPGTEISCRCTGKPIVEGLS